MIQYCENNKDNCIVLLKTPRAGEEVDNGMGVDFEISPYSIICHDREKIKLKFDGKSDMESIMETSNLTHNFEIESCNSLQGMIDNLKEMDGYEVIWRNSEYKEPSELKSELHIGEGDIECNLTIVGSLKVLYSDIANYFKERVNPSNWQSDIFRKAIENHNNKKDMVGCRFIGDSARIKNVMYYDDHIKFVFNMTSRKSFGFNENISTKFIPVNDTMDKRSYFSNVVEAMELKIKNDVHK